MFNGLNVIFYLFEPVCMIIACYFLFIWTCLYDHF